MARSTTIQRKILKINSDDIRSFTEMNLYLNKDNDDYIDKTLKNCIWRYEFDWKNNINSDIIISLGESHTLRMLDDIVGTGVEIRDLYEEKRNAIKLKKSGDETEDGLYLNKSIRQIYNEIDDLQFQENYISIVFKTKDDFKLINKNGLIVNGKSFKRLYGTSSGVKENTIVYVCDGKINEDKTIYFELLERLENGYDKSIKLVPSKYEAYLSLNSSASTKVFSDFKPNEILVVPDQINNIKTIATLIGECEFDSPNILDNEVYEFELEQSDGGGIVDKEIADIWADDLELNYTPSVFIARNSFLKGTLGTMEIQELIKRYRKYFGKVYDIWNLQKPENEREEFDISSIKMIIPTSMLKLWKGYSDIEDYLNKCTENKHSFSVTKATPNKLENERTLNYQFVQSLYLNDEDIDGLTKNTIDAFHDILKNDITKSILYAKGISMNKITVKKSDNDCFKAMMIDSRMLNDMFIKRTIYKMIKRSIDKAKIAKIKTRGNYQMIIPDLISFFKHSMNMDDTSGILKAGEFYSEYWNDLGVNEVVAMRAPACTHANFRKINFIKDRDDLDLFKHIKTAIVFNGYDSTVESLSGADKDGDTVFTTDNKYILNGIKEMNPIICPMNNSSSEEISEKTLALSNMRGFNNNVGAATNKASNIRDKMFWFDNGSDEYEELFRREQSIQRIQQSIIDSVKNGYSEQVPTCWYDNKKNIIIDEEYIEKLLDTTPDAKLPKLDDIDTIENKMFNQKIVADKKPYYFAYIYPEIMNQIKRYKDNWKHNCVRVCGLTIDELQVKTHRTDFENELIELYNSNSPVNDSPSVMNKICHKFEKEFDKYFSKKENKTDFDYSILKTNAYYTKKQYVQVNKIQKEYKDKIRQFYINKRNGIESDDPDVARQKFVDSFKRKVTELSIPNDILCDIVIDMTYGKKSSHQFAWDTCGDLIIDNLLKINNNKIVYFEKDKNGTIGYCGEHFTKRTMSFNKED